MAGEGGEGGGRKEGAMIFEVDERGHLGVDYTARLSAG